MQLTQIDGHGDEDLTRRGFIHMRASLHGIDRFFMKCRRMVMMLERPIPSAANAGRLWHGYTAYNPRVLQKLLDIYRIYYNYCEVGEDKKTPAMRLGLAKGPVKVEQIIYFGSPGGITPNGQHSNKGPYSNSRVPVL